MTRKPENELEFIKVENRSQIILVAGLARDVWSEHYIPIIGRYQVDYMLDRFQSPDAIWNDINENNFIYDLVLAGGKPAAYMASKMDKEKNKVFLSKLYVKKDFRRLGIARGLMKELIQRAINDDCHMIWLTVNKNNLDSIKAYERLGFVKAGEQVKDIGNGFVMDDYILNKIIS